MTIVNSSRIISDINRDLGRIKGNRRLTEASSSISISPCYISILGKMREILLIILTQSQNVRVDLRDVREPRVKKVCTLLVSNRWDNITESDHNLKTINIILEFLNQNILTTTNTSSDRNILERSREEPRGLTRGLI